MAGKEKSHRPGAKKRKNLMKLTALIVVSLSISTFAGFKTYQENAMNIEGRASMKIEPDMATIFIGASAVNEDVDSAMDKCAQAFIKMKKLFEQYKISENDIKSENLSVSENYNYDDGSRKRDGYRAYKRYKVTWYNLKTLQDFLIDATAQGANEVDKIEFTHSKTDSLEKMIIGLAIEDAQNIANQIAKKMNVKIGKPLIISNVEPEKVAYENIVRLGWIKGTQVGRAGKSGIRYGSGNDPMKNVLMEINPGLIEIKNKVYITFEILK
ncbi:MAG: DUF541 domain-containing protein [Candidatus Lokiarchaeota archaeon]|nr:DUF541 domain-containing protein [Candidatus Lokiarchaeota archaeon]